MSDIDTGGPEATEDADIAPDLFTVSVQGAGVGLTRTVDQATALNVIATVLGGSGSVPTVSATYAPHVQPAQRVGTQRETPGGSAISAETLDPDTTVGEYIDECEAQQFPAKITAIGRYLELKLGQSSFTRDEIKSQFRPAGEAPPGNFSRDFNEAITQRWIAEVPGEIGQYFVTKSGKSAIAAKFDKSMRRAAPARRKKMASRSDNGSGTSNGTANAQDLDADE